MCSTFSEELSPEAAGALLTRLTKVQEERRRQRLFYRLFPDEDMVQPDGSVKLAGYAHPNVQGPRMLVNIGIQAAIQERQRVLAGKVEVTQERIVAEYAKIGFADMAAYASWGLGNKLHALDSLARILGYDKPDPRGEAPVVVTRLTVLFPAGYEPAVVEGEVITNE